MKGSPRTLVTVVVFMVFIVIALLIGTCRSEAKAPPSGIPDSRVMVVADTTDGWHGYRVYTGPPAKDTLYVAVFDAAVWQADYIKQIVDNFSATVYLLKGRAPELPFAVQEKAGGGPFESDVAVMDLQGWGRLNRGKPPWAGQQ